MTGLLLYHFYTFLLCMLINLDLSIMGAMEDIFPMLVVTGFGTGLAMCTGCCSGFLCGSMCLLCPCTLGRTSPSFQVDDWVVTLECLFLYLLTLQQ